MILDRIISLIAPHTCLSCGTEGLLACQSCLTEARKPDWRCYLCNALGYKKGICEKCSQESHIASIQATLIYDGLAKELVHKVKFDRAQAGVVAMADAVLPLLPPVAPIISPVPTASSRVRLRGYDQAVLLAKRIANSSGSMAISLLARQLDVRQVGTRRLQRYEQIQAAFRPLPLAHVVNDPIVLIDDIITTGATMRAAACTLHEAGVPEIHVRAFAYAPPK